MDNDTAAEIARRAVRAKILNNLSNILATENIIAVLVKGAALTMNYYPDNSSRPMADIDLLVRKQDYDRTVSLFCKYAEKFPIDPSRRWSEIYFGETKFNFRVGNVDALVEVHHQLDKVVSRGVDYSGIIDRAHRLKEASQLSIPTVEDHVLLIVLHASAHDFLHEVAYRDLEQLFSGPLNVRELLNRAIQWNLMASLYVIIRQMKLLGMNIPAFGHEILPSRQRKALIEKVYFQGPLQPVLGFRWVVRQTVLREDTLNWILGVLRYSLARSMDKFQL